ncbi:hypothetical protein V499_03349 [Pseudogymnoascus sp. VKM F-103]|nr:hypothetical protein V499_03349 [Pseudogymnoascus sp. VKM F-103]
MIVLPLLDPKRQLNIRPKRLPLAIIPLSIELQTPHRRPIFLILVAALIDDRPHLNAELVLPLRDAPVGVGDAGEGVRDGAELLVGRGEAGQRHFYGGAGAADHGVEDVAGDWGFGGGHCEWDLQRGEAEVGGVAIATLEMSCGCGFLFVAGVEPALDSKDGPASSEVAALSYEQGSDCGAAASGSNSKNSKEALGVEETISANTTSNSSSLL